MKEQHYQVTHIGNIPIDWRCVSFKHILQNMPEYGANASSTEYDPLSTYRYIRITDIDDKGCLVEKEQVGILKEQGANYLLEDDDIVIARTGNTVGKSFLYKRHYGDCAYAGYLIRFKIDKSKCQVELISHFLKSPIFWKWVKTTIRSGAQPNINSKEYQSMPIPLPPFAEQKKISEVLGTWDTGIEVLGKLIAAKQKRKKALMQQLLTGKKRFKEFKGQKWKHLKADEIFKSYSQKKNDGEELLSVTQDRGVIPRNMLEGKVVMPEGTTDGYKLIVPGDFIISLRSFQGGLEYSNYRGLVSPAYTVLKSKIKIDSSFYKHYFKSYNFVGHLAVAVIGIRDGKQVSYDDFAFLNLPYPSLEEQQKIASVLNSADREIDLLQKKLECMKQQKKGLMQKLLTGTIRVNV